MELRTGEVAREMNRNGVRILYVEKFIASKEERLYVRRRSSPRRHSYASSIYFSADG